jgi:hypothetical protein
MAVILAKRTQAFDHMSGLNFFTGATRTGDLQNEPKFLLTFQS